MGFQMSKKYKVIYKTPPVFISFDITTYRKYIKYTIILYPPDQGCC